MQKPGGVIVAAIILAFLTLIGALSVIGIAVTFSIMPRPANTPQQSMLIVQAVVTGFLVIPTVFSACVSVGLFRGRNWARIAGVVLGILIALTSSLFLLSTSAMMLIPQLRTQFANARFGLVFADMLYLAVAAFGVWLAVYLNLKRIRQAFHYNALYVPAPEAYATNSGTISAIPSVTAAYVAVPSPGMPQTQRSVPRIVVVVIAVLMLAGSLSLLGMAAAGLPFFYLGITLQGPSAILASVVLGVLNIGIAVGLLRRFIPAYYAALVLQVLGIASLLTLLSPSLRSRAIASSMAFSARISAPQPPQMQSMMHSIQNGALLLNALLMPLILGFFIWALLRDLANIRNPAAPIGRESD